jgi:hypothetical protein
VTGMSVPAVTATAKVPLPGACAGFSRLHTQAGMKASQCTGRFGTHRQVWNAQAGTFQLALLGSAPYQWEQRAAQLTPE